MTQQLATKPEQKPQPSAWANQRHQEHLRYLQRVSEGDNPLIRPETACSAREAWQLLWMASGYEIDVPSACTGPEGEMFYSWDNGSHHLELEIIPGKPAEFFYRNRATEEVWGEDYTIGDTLSPSVLQKINLIKTNA